MEKNSNLTPKAQNLRKNATKEENLLWYQFLRHYSLPVKRQKVIGHYIVDFYCHQAKLVIELDGSQHYDAEAIAYDRKRSAYLESQGLQVLRFTNLEVLREFRAVCDMIDRIVKQRAGIHEKIGK